MDNRKLFKASAVYVIAGFLPLAANFLLAPIYTKYLSPEDYGMIALANIFQSILTLIVGLSLSAAYIRYYFDYYKSPKLLNAYFSTILLSLVFLGVGVGIVLVLVGDAVLSFSFQEEGFTFSKYGVWVYITTLCFVLQALFISEYRNNQQIRKFIILNLLFFFLPVALTLVGLIYLELGAWGAIVGRAVGCFLVMGALLILYCKNNTLVFKKSYLIKSLEYALPILLYQIILFGFGNYDRIMVERMFDLSTLGIYNFALIVGNLVVIFMSSVNNAVVPNIYKLLQENPSGFKESIRKINASFLMVSIFVICACSAVAGPLVKIFINDSYHSIDGYIGFIFLSNIYYAAYMVHSLPLFYYKKTKIFPIISLIALVIGAGTSYALATYFGLIGICIGVLSIRFLQLLFTRIFNKYLSSGEIDYLKLPELDTLVTILIVSYLLLYTGNETFADKSLPMDVINSFPLFVFCLLVPLLYKNELSHIYAISRRLVLDRIKNNV